MLPNKAVIVSVLDLMRPYVFNEIDLYVQKRRMKLICLISNAVRDPKTRLAKLKVDSTFTAPCNASILYPEDGGNMHRFTAKTACAVLDVLGPPYCNPEGRHCTYFLEFPFDKFSSGQLFFIYLLMMIVFTYFIL